jgi:hypothetical protein
MIKLAFILRLLERLVIAYEKKVEAQVADARCHAEAALSQVEYNHSLTLSNAISWLDSMRPRTDKKEWDADAKAWLQKHLGEDGQMLLLNRAVLDLKRLIKGG